jgi:hypothetical protein
MLLALGAACWLDNLKLKNVAWIADMALCHVCSVNLKRRHPVNIIILLSVINDHE